MLLQARDQLGIDMHNAIFIGDSIGDINTALAAGVHPVLVLTSWVWSISVNTIMRLLDHFILL